MRTLLIWLLLCSGALAQGCGPNNPNCIVPTAPPGTSDNRAASTAFVQAAIGTSGGFSPAVSYTWTATQFFNAGLSAILTDPTVPGFPIGFQQPPTTPGYYNGLYQFVTVDGTAPGLTNGALFNALVNNTYCWQFGGITCNHPVFVNLRSELKVVGGTGTGTSGGNGNDYWALLGNLDIENPGGANLGGQATSGLVRGNWTGTCLCNGAQFTAENYSGQANAGVLITSSQINAGGAFDNRFAIGAQVHQAANYGFLVGGLFGPVNAILPQFPFAVVNANSTSTLWAIQNNAGTSVTMNLLAQGVGVNVNGANTGNTQLIRVDNSGTSTTVGTNAQFAATLSGLNINTAFFAFEVLGGAAPIAEIVSGSSITGGIVVNSAASKMAFQDNGTNILDYGFNAAGRWTFNGILTNTGVSGGGYLCIDASGIIYRKTASCP